MALAQTLKGSRTNRSRDGKPCTDASSPPMITVVTDIQYWIDRGFTSDGIFMWVQELGRLVEAVHELPGVIYDEDRYPVLVSQSCLDAFYLHVRTVGEFLRSTARRRDDIRAADILPAFELSASHDAELGLIVDEASKVLAHITVARMGDGIAREPIPVDTSKEHLEQIATTLLRAWDAFARESHGLFPKRTDFGVWREPGGELITAAYLRNKKVSRGSS